MDIEMDFLEQQTRLRKTLEAEGITDVRVLDMIENTRRDFFVPLQVKSRACEDIAIPIDEGQTISQPYIVALMTQALALTGDETILEIGTGSGYQAAILASLCGRLITMERLPGLAATAEELLRQLGFADIGFVTGDGTLGFPQHAPYDGIIVTAAAPKIPARLYEQLSPGGRMVIPVGDESLQQLLLIRKPIEGDPPKPHVLCNCRFVKLIGEAGW